MIHRVESNPKSAHFKWIISLYTLLQPLNSLPVFLRKGSIIHRQQCWTLEWSQARMGKGTTSKRSTVNKKLDLLCSCIISILDHLLYDKSRWVGEFCAINIHSSLHMWLGTISYLIQQHSLCIHKAITYLENLAIWISVQDLLDGNVQWGSFLTKLLTNKFFVLFCHFYLRKPTSLKYVAKIGSYASLPYDNMCTRN